MFPVINQSDKVTLQLKIIYNFPVSKVLSTLTTSSRKTTCKEDNGVNNVIQKKKRKDNTT